MFFFFFKERGGMEGWGGAGFQHVLFPFLGKVSRRGKQVLKGALTPPPPPGVGGVRRIIFFKDLDPGFIFFKGPMV